MIEGSKDHSEWELFDKQEDFAHLNECNFVHIQNKPRELKRINTSEHAALNQTGAEVIISQWIHLKFMVNCYDWIIKYDIFELNIFFSFILKDI